MKVSPTQNINIHAHFYQLFLIPKKLSTILSLDNTILLTLLLLRHQSAQLDLGCSHSKGQQTKLHGNVKSASAVPYVMVYTLHFWIVQILILKRNYTL